MHESPSNDSGLAQNAASPRFRLRQRPVSVGAILRRAGGLFLLAVCLIVLFGIIFAQIYDTMNPPNHTINHGIGSGGGLIFLLLYFPLLIFLLLGVTLLLVGLIVGIFEAYQRRHPRQRRSSAALWLSGLGAVAMLLVYLIWSRFCVQSPTECSVGATPPTLPVMLLGIVGVGLLVLGLLVALFTLLSSSERRGSKLIAVILSCLGLVSIFLAINVVPGSKHLLRFYDVFFYSLGPGLQSSFWLVAPFVLIALIIVFIAVFSTLFPRRHALPPH